MRRYIAAMCCLLVWASEGSAAVALSRYHPQVSVEQLSSEVNWRMGEGKWDRLNEGTTLTEGSEIDSGNGSLTFKLGEGSTVEMEPHSVVRLEALQDTHQQPLIIMQLSKGRIRLNVVPYPQYRSISVSTSFAALFPEGAARFIVTHDQLTTLAVEEGVVMMQAENPSIRSLNLLEGEQVSLNKDSIGPLVAAGAPPTLEEPKELKYRRLELGQMQQCERQGEGEEVCGSWSWNKSRQLFEASWENGSIAVLRLEKMGDGEIVLNRVDEAGATKGLTARYVGKSAGTHMQGDVAEQLLEGSVVWEYQGKKSEGSWQAHSSYWLDLGETPQ